MLHAYPEDNELIEKLQNNFMDSLTEKNLVFSQIRKDYLNNCTKDFSIDFDDNCILIEGDI